MNEQLTVTDLYERYSTALKWRLVRQLHNVADAEDVLQEVFVRVTRYWPTLPDKRYPWPWLTTVARSVMIDSGRTRAARQMHTISLEYEHAREEDDNFDARREWLIDPRQHDPLDVVVRRDEARREWHYLSEQERAIYAREALRGDVERSLLYATRRNVKERRKRRSEREAVGA